MHLVSSTKGMIVRASARAKPYSKRLMDVNEKASFKKGI